MNFYTGDYVIVTRHSRDTTRKGHIIDSGLSQTWAKERARKLSEQDKDNSFWAMTKSEWMI